MHLAFLSDVAEVVFNKCLMENDYPPEHYKYCITFDYELLDDMFSKWDDNSSGKRIHLDSSRNVFKQGYAESRTIITIFKQTLILYFDWLIRIATRVLSFILLGPYQTLF